LKEAKMANEIIKCTMEQLIEENKVLKETNQILSDLVDNYDKELKDTTDVLEKTTDKLKEVTKIIEATEIIRKI
jgi:uncharacterized phage infection (PIP) family protein YhgE